MNSDAVVSNASPLIALEQIGRLHLLKDLFGHVLVPPAVAGEVAPTLALPDWTETRTLVQPIDPQILGASLGPGESEAIGLALEIRARLVILDDRPARRLAQKFQLKIIGTLGILLAAKQRGHLPLVRPCLDDLLRFDFRMSQELYEQILRDPNEP